MPLNKEVHALAARWNKQLGGEVIVMASSLQEAQKFPTGSLSLDVALGGGWAGNQWAEIYGKESHGKTAVCLKTVAANQQADPDFTTVWIAGEHYDTDQATALGVDNDRVMVVQTTDMVVAYEAMLDSAWEKAVDCIVLDSYPALSSPEEETKGMADATVSVGARLTGKFFRKVGAATHREKNERPLLGLFINQQRDNIGAWSPGGRPQTTPGGNGKNYAFYTRVDVKRDEYIEEPLVGKNMAIRVGQSIKLQTVKNKAAAPQQVAVVDFYFREAPVHGFHRGEYDYVKELITLSLVFDVITRRGSRFYFGETRWDGKDPMWDAVREDMDLRAALDAEVRRVALSKGEKTTIVSEGDIERVENMDSAVKPTTTRRRRKQTDDVPA